MIFATTLGRHCTSRRWPHTAPKAGQLIGIPPQVRFKYNGITDVFYNFPSGDNLMRRKFLWIEPGNYLVDYKPRDLLSRVILLTTR